jgi:hypothetical protein
MGHHSNSSSSSKTMREIFPDQTINLTVSTPMCEKELPVNDMQATSLSCNRASEPFRFFKTVDKYLSLRPLSPARKTL